MSLSVALSAALTGLSAAQRGTQTVAGNVANAATPGYGARRLDLAVADVGAGVRVTGEARLVDPALLADRRLGDAAAGQAGTAAELLSRALSLLGDPGTDDGLSARVGDLEAAFIAAASRPDDQARLAALLDAAQGLAGALKAAGDGVQDLRADADAEIAAAVDRLNAGLAEVDALNDAIRRGGSASQGVNGLIDQRQAAIDRIADLVPVRVLPRDAGGVALYTPDGLALLETAPVRFEFSPTATITADMTLASGALSSVTRDGLPISTDGRATSLSGGRIAALFAFRDGAAQALQTDLDALAQDLIARFEDPTLDPTLVAGDAGVFTDGGGALDLLDTVGLASRIGVNAAVDPAAGGALWRLRDGIGAAAPGPIADSALLTALSDRLTEVRTPPATAALSRAAGFGDQTGDVAAYLATALIRAEQTASFTAARTEALTDAERANGVDTDQELQKLLLLEQAYAANARVIRTVDEMLDLLAEI